MVVPPAETPPPAPAAVPEEIEIIADTAETEPASEPHVAEIAEPVLE